MSPPISPGAVSISFDNDDMDEEETATEVEVAEKTVKFKISTETAIPGRNTCPSKLHTFLFLSNLFILI